VATSGIYQNSILFFLVSSVALTPLKIQAQYDSQAELDRATLNHLVRNTPAH
jgi:hypothetical protein